MPDGRSVGLVVNPTSGRGKAGRLLPEIRARLISMGCEAEVYTSASAAHASELAAEASRRHEVVAAVGGDGMVAFVAQGVMGTAAALGIVPAGTGNDLAANLGHTRGKPLEACAVLARGTRRRIDVGRIEGGRVFLCVAGGGEDQQGNQRQRAASAPSHGERRAEARRRAELALGFGLLQRFENQGHSANVFGTAPYAGAPAVTRARASHALPV